VTTVVPDVACAVLCRIGLQVHDTQALVRVYCDNYTAPHVIRAADLHHLARTAAVRTLGVDSSLEPAWPLIRVDVLAAALVHLRGAIAALFADTPFTGARASPDLMCGWQFWVECDVDIRDMATRALARAWHDRAQAAGVRGPGDAPSGHKRHTQRATPGGPGATHSQPHQRHKVG